MTTILLLNGPNLNLLGTREPEVYGHTTLADIEQTLIHLSASLRYELICKQSNAEHDLINAVHQAKQHVDFIITNPAAYSHTSIALRDAFLAVQIPFVEVHLSNIYKREPFRHHSYLSDIAVGIISGLGVYGYEAALQFAHRYLTSGV